MEQQESPRWWAVVAVMIGIFLLVTAEQLPIGLLSQVAESMGVTPGMAGLMVTVPGVVAAFSAPLLLRSHLPQTIPDFHFPFSDLLRGFNYP